MSQQANLLQTGKLIPLCSQWRKQCYHQLQLSTSLVYYNPFLNLQRTFFPHKKESTEVTPTLLISARLVSFSFDCLNKQNSWAVTQSFRESYLQHTCCWVQLLAYD